MDADTHDHLAVISHLARKIRARYAPDEDGMGDARAAEWADEILAAADELRDEL